MPSLQKPRPTRKIQGQKMALSLKIFTSPRQRQVKRRTLKFFWPGLTLRLRLKKLSRQKLVSILQLLTNTKLKKVQRTLLMLSLIPWTIPRLKLGINSSCSFAIR